MYLIYRVVFFVIFYKWNRTLEYIVSAGTFKDYDRDKYLSYYKDSIPYIDGGCIITKKSILQNVPLNENIAWGEAEDVEWSKRLFLNGYLMDFLFENPISQKP